MFESLWGSIHIFWCMSEHHICLGFVALFACIYFVLQLLTGFLHVKFALWPGQETHTHFLAYMLHSYISQTGCSGSWHVHAGFLHDDPRGKNVLSLLRGCPGPFWAPFLARLCHCSAVGLFCCVHDAPARVSRLHYIQTLSPAQLQPVTSACVLARPACACVPGV